MCNDPMYWLFAGDHYYPCGGVGDYQGSFMSLADAVAKGDKRDWWHVTDEKLNIIKDYYD